MADEKLNTGPAENISPEAAEPITTPEQAAASEPQQEQTGPAIPESGDVVVSFDKINELMAEKRQNARAKDYVRDLLYDALRDANISVEAFEQRISSERVYQHCGITRTANPRGRPPKEKAGEQS